MMMVHLSHTPPNMSSIRAVWDSLGKTFLTSLVGNLGATGGLQVSSSPVKAELIIFPLFLLKGNAILPMTLKAGCGYTEFFYNKMFIRSAEYLQNIFTFLSSH